jgi:hypothetical protein
MSLDRYETTGVIQDGRLKVRYQHHFEQAMRAMPDGPVVIRIEPATAPRSLRQNTTYWRWYVTPLAEYTGYSPLAIHAYLKQRFLVSPRIVISDAQGEVVDEARIEPTTTTLTTQEFSAYLDAISEFAESLNVPVGVPVNADAYAR